MKNLLTILFLFLGFQAFGQDNEYVLNVRTGKFDVVRTAAFVSKSIDTTNKISTHSYNDQNFIKVFSTNWTKVNGANANTIYIDPNFGGTPHGTITEPLTGMPSTSDMVANTTYLFKRGTTYNHSNKINIQVPGVTLGAYGNGNAPIINQTTNNDNIIGAGSLTVQDLELIVPTGAGGQDGYQLSFAGATGYLNVSNCKIHGGGQGVRVLTSPTMDVKVNNCVIYDMWSDGCFITSVKSLELSYCNIYNINISHPSAPDDGDNIQIDDIPNVWVHHNILDHSTQENKFCILVAALSLNFVGNAVIEYNEMTRSRSGDHTVFYSSYSHLSNIVFRYNKIKNAVLAIQSRTYDMKVYGNSFTNIDRVYECNAPSDFDSHPVFYNNTIYNCNQIIYGFGEFVDVKNCIFHTVRGVGFTGSHITNDYNDNYLVSNLGEDPGPNDISDDPILADTTSTISDFSLRSTSPCIGTGVVIPGFTVTSNVNRGSGLNTVFSPQPIAINEPLYLKSNLQIDKSLQVGDTITCDSIKVGAIWISNTTSGVDAAYVNNKVLWSDSININIGHDTRSFTGQDNVFIGRFVAQVNTTGNTNLAMGTLSLNRNTTGNGNIALGGSSLRLNTTGFGNIAVGVNPLFNNTQGSFNVALGYSALLNNSTGTNNIALGSYAGNFSQTLSKRLFFNSLIRSSIANDSLKSIIYGSQDSLVNNQKLCFNANRVYINEGTANTYVAVPGILKDFFTDAATVSAGETDLYTYTVPANVLAKNGDKLVFEVTFDVSSSPTDAFIKFYFAGTALTWVNNGGLSGICHARYSIIRVSTTVCRIQVNGDNATNAITNYAELTSKDFTTGNIIKVTGQAATNSIVAKMGYIEYKPAAVN